MATEAGGLQGPSAGGARSRAEAAGMTLGTIRIGGRTKSMSGQHDGGPHKIDVLLDELSCETYRTRQRAVHAIATLLSQEDASDRASDRLERAIEHLRSHSPFPSLVQLATEAEAAADTLTLSLIFSAMANLAAHLVPLEGSARAVGHLLGHAFVVASAEPPSAQNALLSFCMAAAYNLSAELQVLAALDETGCAPVLLSISKRKGRFRTADARTVKNAKSTLSNMKRAFSAAQRAAAMAAQKAAVEERDSTEEAKAKAARDAKAAARAAKEVAREASREAAKKFKHPRHQHFWDTITTGTKKLFTGCTQCRVELLPSVLPLLPNCWNELTNPISLFRTCLE